MLGHMKMQVADQVSQSTLHLDSWMSSVIQLSFYTLAWLLFVSISLVFKIGPYSLLRKILLGVFLRYPRTEVITR